jgi:hypothetical protein
MSGSQLGTYQPPVFREEAEKPKKETKEEDNFNLLDIDFEDYNNQSHASSVLDHSDVDIKEELPKIPEKGFLATKAPEPSRAKATTHDDINANSGPATGSEARLVDGGGDDLEGGAANIVNKPAGWHKYVTVDYYKQYFEISTEEVITRLVKA